MRLYTNTSGSWAVASGASAAGTNPATSTGSATVSGLWTVGALGIFYSYQSGPWNDASTWTSDPGGTTGPGAVVPGFSDKVVILSGRTVTLAANVVDQNLDITINNGGILDQSNFAFTGAGGLAAAIKGKWLSQTFILKLPAQLPLILLLQQTEVILSITTTVQCLPLRRHIITLLYGRVGTVTQVNNITLNGNLDVKQGIFQINDGTDNRRLQLIVNGDVTVDIPGSIAIGNGVTNTQVSPLSINGTNGSFPEIL